MATIHFETDDNRADLRRYIEQGIGRLQLSGASPDLESRLQDALEAKAQGMFLWVKLMLEILEAQSTEKDILDQLAAAPSNIEGGSEPREFNTILAWLAYATRPLSLTELDTILRRLSPCGNKVLSLETKLRERYGSLVTLVRDDGLSTGMLQMRGYSTIATNMYDSMPETTTVHFSHAAIAEYFRNCDGKYSIRKSAPNIGIVRLECQYVLLRNCLDVFTSASPNGQDVSLRPYAMENWYAHLKAVPSILDTISTSEQAHLVTVLHTFLTNGDALRAWCRDTPWTFYSSETGTNLAKWCQTWSRNCFGSLNNTVQEWVTACTAKAEVVFLEVARVNAKEGLHGPVRWYPLPALSVVAQVKALVEGADTLDTIPEPMPLDTILKAVEWAKLEPTATWHRKLAVCLRNSGYDYEAITHFETAIEMDHSLALARTGAIEIELINASILAESRNQDIAGGGDEDVDVAQQLARSYNVVARSYEQLRDIPSALKYWRKSAETGEIVQWGVLQYLRLLADSSKDSRRTEIMWLLRLLDSKAEEGKCQSRLTSCILAGCYPSRTPGDFFPTVATAAVETGSVLWLKNAYETAMSCSKSHVTIINLKFSIIELHKRFTKDLTRIEPLIKEMIEVACLDPRGRIRELERCKQSVAYEYCYMFVRDAILAGPGTYGTEQSIRKLATLCRSGLEPRDLASKRFNGDYTTAAVTLGPYMLKSCTWAAAHDQRTSQVGLLSLVACLLAMGREDEARAVANLLLSRSQWLCAACLEVPAAQTDVSICRHRLECFCSRCLPAVSSQSQYCVPDHSVFRVSSELGSENGNIGGGVELLQQEWQEYIEPTPDELPRL
ncbi:hypothetical protein BDV95DRAFT_631856 [Massariosphaeria phaeospora]|uniref:Uncharacterized protein n=1 Tax=Massariosphaeria phaeospora TaxID=100035 RepID=A0A7C8I152_9PLEO|nr:hypothetical protein BDV95DRAFT_631856 [Massariosphaeria phaeospora]